MINQPSVAALRKDDRFTGFLLVRMAEQRQSNKGDKYLDMTLGDATGDLNAKVWDSKAVPPQVGTVIKVRATVQEYNGRLQMRVEQLRAAAPQDEVDMSLLALCAPEAPEKMLAEIHAVIDAMKSEELQKILREMISACGDRLSYYPAAQRLHHAERSGLLHHTVSMLRTARAILPLYPFLDADLLLAGVIAHDLSKTAEMQSDELGNVRDYTAEGLLLGHLVRGVTEVRLAADRAGVSGEYVLLLQHMVISHHGEAEFGSPRPPMFPEAEALHMIDDLDAKMNEMEGVMKRTPKGSFSEKIWSLDRRLYHPNYADEADAELPFEPAPAARPRQERRDSGRAYEGLL